MTDETIPRTPAGNGGYERSDIGVARRPLFPAGPGRRRICSPTSSSTAIYSYPRQALRSRAGSGQSAGHQRSRRHAPHPEGLSADRIPQSETRNRRARPVERHPPQGRRNAQHLRLHRQKRRHRPHPHRPRHGPDRPARPPRARAIRQPEQAPAAQPKPAPENEKKEAKK